MQSKIMLPITFFIAVMLIVRLINGEAEDPCLSTAEERLKQLQQEEVTHEYKQDSLPKKDSTYKDSATPSLNIRP